MAPCCPPDSKTDVPEERSSISPSSYPVPSTVPTYVARPHLLNSAEMRKQTQRS